MSACEKCWAEAGGDADHYEVLRRMRDCEPEEQAGPQAKRCPNCERMTLHQCSGECMCGCVVTAVSEDAGRG
jgi:hypothetical protein